MAKLDKLVTYAYVKDEVDLPTNIPDQEFDKPITRAQEVLRMLIGEDFYQDFQTNFQANTLSSAYTTLFPYIKQFLAWDANEKWTLKANFKPTRSGFRVHSEDNSTVASDAAMAAIYRDAKAQSQFYKNILIAFLDSHSGDYPLYGQGCHNPNTGNSFKISAVKNVNRQPDLYGRNHGCKC
jgi:hypothetical protein